MATYSDFTKWHALPITLVQLYYGSAGADIVGFYNIDVNSSFEITPIFAPNQTDSGVQRVVAYKLNANIIVGDNDVDALKTDINLMSGTQPKGTSIVFGGALQNKANQETVTLNLGTSPYGSVAFTSDAGGFGTFVNFNLRNTADLQFEIQLEATLSVDAINDPSNYLFS